MQSNNNESLIRRIFFLISLLCGLRGGDAYKLEMQSFSRRLDGGLNLLLYTEKNNQRGVFKRNKYGKSSARKIPIPADQEDGRYKPINDILKYISKRPKDASEFFFLETATSKKGIFLLEFFVLYYNINLINIYYYNSITAKCLV
jgi:hypothetical protein